MTILSELHQDHVNLNKLLQMLESKVERLREGDQPDFNLLGDVVEYITDYADGLHHPREDMLYEYFQGRDSELDKNLSLCDAEHKELKGLGEQFKETIECIVHDAVMPMSEFIEKLADFLSCQRRHLDMEEGVLFPAINAVATEADWAVLIDKLPRPVDPLFGEKQAAKFTSLYKEMILDLNN